MRSLGRRSQRERGPEASEGLLSFDYVGKKPSALGSDSGKKGTDRKAGQNYQRRAGNPMLERQGGTTPPGHLGWPCALLYFCFIFSWCRSLPPW